jgi:hypothetical protein
MFITSICATIEELSWIDIYDLRRNCLIVGKQTTLMVLPSIKDEWNLGYDRGHKKGGG